MSCESNVSRVFHAIYLMAKSYLLVYRVCFTAFIFQIFFVNNIYAVSSRLNAMDPYLTVKPYEWVLVRTGHFNWSKKIKTTEVSDK